jgi:hypothetical protein
LVFLPVVGSAPASLAAKATATRQKETNDSNFPMTVFRTGEFSFELGGR